MRTFATLLAAGLALLGTGAPMVAAATPRQLAPGVFAAPNTPAGKEYALRLQQARSTGSQPRTTHQGAPSLFGAGIATASPSPAAKPARPKPPGASSRRSPATPALSTKSSPGPAAVGSIPAASGSGGGGGTLALVGGAAAILVLAGLGAVLFRRRRPLGPSG
jgi:hypothetical protein